MQRAYILRVKPFRDRQYLVNLFAEDAGHIASIARVSSGKSQSFQIADLQLFQLVWIDLKGRHDLKRLTQLEKNTKVSTLSTEHKLAAFYINELCLRLLPQSEMTSELFDSYDQLMGSLSDDAPLRTCLRYFELNLLDHLGVMPNCLSDEQGLDVLECEKYFLILNQMFRLDASQSDTSYSGAMLLRLYQQKLILSDWRDAQRLMYVLLQPLLGKKPLASRDLMRQYKGE